MAQALVPSIGEPQSSGTNIVVPFSCWLTGTEFTQAQPYTLEFTIVPGDTATTIRTKMVSAITALATSLGVTIANNGILLPTYQKV